MKPIFYPSEMSDKRLRELENSFQKTGSVEDERFLLAEQLRVGILREERVKLASLLRYPAARGVFVGTTSFYFPEILTFELTAEIGKEMNMLFLLVLLRMTATELFEITLRRGARNTQEVMSLGIIEYEEAWNQHREEMVSGYFDVYEELLVRLLQSQSIALESRLQFQIARCIRLMQHLMEPERFPERDFDVSFEVRSMCETLVPWLLERTELDPVQERVKKRRERGESLDI